MEERESVQMKSKLSFSLKRKKILSKQPLTLEEKVMDFENTSGSYNICVLDISEGEENESNLETVNKIIENKFSRAKHRPQLTHRINRSQLKYTSQTKNPSHIIVQFFFFRFVFVYFFNLNVFILIGG